MMRHPRDLRPGALAVAFAAITATVFGLYLATRVRYGGDIHASGVVWIVAWIVGAAVVGRVVARMPSTLHAVLVTVMIGLMSAMPVFAMWSSPIHSTRTILLSVFGVWPALLVVVALLGRGAERARARSVIRSAFVRSLTIAVLSVVVVLAMFSLGAHAPRSIVIGLLGLAGLVCVVGAGVDVRALRASGDPHRATQARPSTSSTTAWATKSGAIESWRRYRAIARAPSSASSSRADRSAQRGARSSSRWWWSSSGWCHRASWP